MQVVDQKNIEKRLLYYWSKMYNSSIKEGTNYERLEKSIVILITNYELEGLKEIQKYITKWNIREVDYPKFILTPVLEIYIIELPKFNKYKKIEYKNLNSWVKFIESPEVIDMEENSAISKAREVLEEISQDEHERYLAELRQKYIMDQKAIEDAGYDKGLKDGIEQEKKETNKKLKQQKKELAKKMLEKNMPIRDIIELTELTKEEIENLK